MSRYIKKYEPYLRPLKYYKLKRRLRLKIVLRINISLTFRL